jgi:hypothetical protein
MEKPRTPTPLSEAALAQQIVSAYQTHFGHAPDRETAELLLALIDIENAHGNSIIQFNWGNISTFVKDSIDYWRPPWFDLDAVNALPDGPNKSHLLFEHAEMAAHRAPVAFLAFNDHDTGARVFLSNVKPSMYDAAATGDPMAFALAYWSSGYCPDEACKNSGPTFQKLQASIRAAGYFNALAPAKKKAVSPPVTSPAQAAEPLPSSPSPAPASPSGSSSPLSGLGGAANLRNLVVFAASCHLENVTLMVENHDPSAVAEFVATLWDDVLEHPSPRTASGTRILKYPPEWCGAFALHCLHEAHLATGVKWAFGPPHYGFLYRLHTTKTPEPGDIAYLDKPWQHHAIVTDVEGDTVHTIDGNQGALAPIKTHSAPLSHWTAFYSILPFITEVMA